MLTTIVEGIRPDRPDVIRHAAAIALRNSLYFSAKNMETAHERNMIMQTICEATQSKEAKVRAAAYECIVQIALLYYDKLQDYMQILFQLTFQTIKNDEGEVALQAIEFWSTLCEEEASLMEMMDSENDDGSPRPVCVQYVAAAVPHLVPLLTESLTRQEEDTDGDEEAWNVSMASATCISLIATTVQDKIVPVIMPFVLQHIKNENWRFREAATMAFCSILEGPSDDVIGPYVNQSIPVLLAALSDPHIMVKDTTAWTIGRICELHARAIPQELFPTLLEGLISKLMTESPKVSSQACFALHNIAAAFADDDNADRIGTNSLSPYVPTLLQTFLSVVDRADADENNLRVTAFEAISVLIQNSAPDCRPILIQLLPVILGRLTTSFSISVLTNEEKEKKEGIQGLLCGIIQVITMKLGKDDIMPFSDSIMHNLIQVLQTKNATCHVESFSAISALCTIMEGDFNVRSLLFYQVHYNIC
jgi:importin subunit beta-1